MGISFCLEMAILFESFNTGNLADITYWISGMTFTVNLLIKRSAYRRFITRVTMQLRIKDRDQIQSFSQRNVLIFLIYFVMFLVTVAPFYWRPERWPLKRIFIDQNSKSQVLFGLGILSHMHEVSLMCMWMTVGMCLYLTAHLMKHKFSIRCLKILTLLTNDQDRFVAMSVMTDVVNQFAETFSNIPFFILTANFFEASGYLLAQIGHVELQLLHRLQMISLALTFLSTVIIICMTVAKRHEELEGVRDQVIRWIESKNVKTLNDSLLIQCVQRSVKPDTAWKMFTIDKSMVAAYLGQLLAFSVLFNQMMPVPHQAHD
jgi:hypothetical protein